MLADLVFVLGAVTLTAVVAWWEFFCLTDLAHADRVRFLPRWLWAVLCLIQIPLGGILYLLLGRPRRRPATSGAAAP